MLVQGTDLSRQKNYAEAEEYFKKALEKNPNLVPALTQMAQIMYRQGLYDKAREFAGKALAVDTYDAAANYFWGLSSEKTGSDSDALTAFQLQPSLLISDRLHGLRIAYLAIKRKNWKEAEYVIRQMPGELSSE